MATKTRKKKSTSPDAATAFDAVRVAAESIRSDAPATVPAMEPGDVLRQGDLYVIALDSALPGKPTHARQLAPGTTQGSRHVAEGPCEVVEPEGSAALSALHRLIPATRAHRQFVGPAIHATAPITIAHPEHGDRTLPPGDYLVTYQRAWADEVRRTQD